MNESYCKCRTCRFCRHSDGIWVCVSEVRSTRPDGTCRKYRPGCCENCISFTKEVCARTGVEVFPLDVCSDYDPAGSF